MRLNKGKITKEMIARAKASETLLEATVQLVLSISLTHKIEILIL